MSADAKSAESAALPSPREGGDIGSLRSLTIGCVTITIDHSTPRTAAEVKRDIRHLIATLTDRYQSTTD